MDFLDRISIEYFGIFQQYTFKYFGSELIDAIFGEKATEM